MSEVSLPTRKFQKELNAGITSLILLYIVEKSEEPLYGYQIAKKINFENKHGFSMKQSGLYPVLRSLEKNELLESSVEPSVSGPPRRYYCITDTGSKALIKWKEIWSDLRANVDNILEGEKND
ncbi:MAG TPA: PadR family transcriptional regulator [Spirochaeta sp.]|nr:PadR family transcriptional regulator [Spirochaeta sp.]